MLTNCRRISRYYTLHHVDKLPKNFSRANYHANGLPTSQGFKTSQRTVKSTRNFHQLAFSFNSLISRYFAQCAYHNT